MQTLRLRVVVKIKDSASWVLPIMSEFPVESFTESGRIYVADKKSKERNGEKVIHMLNHLKAQVTMINLIVVLVVMFMFFAFLPILISFTNDYALPAINGVPGDPSHPGLDADQPTKDLTTAIISLFAVVIALSIIITVLYYAIPRREGQ
jgi:hypothetical protein